MTLAAYIRPLRSLRLAALGLAFLAHTVAATAAAPEGSSETLRARYTSLKAQLADNAFERPIHLESTQSSGDQRGDIYAVVDHGFATMKQHLSQADQWCDVLILHLNVKHCGASGPAAARVLTVTLGKKVDQELSDAYRVAFDYVLGASTGDYLQVQLRADEGPLGTSDYRILMEAMPLDSGRSFMHMTYSYAYGMAARVAMQGYLSTLGAGKIGFTVVGKDADGKPRYVDNVRGLVERNTMRYYLAIEAYLDSMSVPAGQRSEKRLQDWFDATERHAAQLHEIDKGEYLEMKHRELERQKSGVAAP